ncbi:MAG: SDR family NAD(P)-dependent oxidoreductase [Gammaproteobacteria bacterium]
MCRTIAESFMLAGKQIVVTGANGTLGSAAVERALTHGASVIAVDLSFNESTNKFHQIAVDLTDIDATRAAIGGLDKVDAVCNIAGGFSMGPDTYALNNDEWDQLFAMNVTTMRNVNAALVPIMLKQKAGKIVNVGALSAREGQGQMSAYCASKSTVMRLTESLSKEVRREGINVNAVLPSIIDTPTNRYDMPDANFSEWVAPIDLAEVMLFLCSDAARPIHGALVPVPGLA